MVERKDHEGIVVDHLAAATEYFVALGLELQGGWDAGLTKTRQLEGRLCNRTRSPRC
jgi:hypothetical protein